MRRWKKLKKLIRSMPSIADTQQLNSTSNGAIDLFSFLARLV